LNKALTRTAERARGRVSPVTKRRVRRLASWFYLRQPSLRRTTGGDDRTADVSAGWRTTDPPPLGVLACLIASNEHGDYCVPQSSQRRPVAQAILNSRVWEADTLNLIRHADPDGDIVHAGTFFGDFLPALSAARTDGARVWAFEPGSENFRCAQVTITLNGLENVVLTNAALGASTRRALLQTTDREGVPLGGASRLLANPLGGGPQSKEKVRVLTLDEALASDRRVGVLHLDVEGHEQQALAGAMRTIERCLPLIVLETLPDPAWVASELSPLGYEPDGRVDENFILRCPR
jgi:FkbM family methyltransferase